MNGPHSCSPEAEEPAEASTLQHPSYTIRLQQTPMDWIAVITRSNHQTGFVLAADCEAVLVKAGEWIGAHSKLHQASS